MSWNAEKHLQKPLPSSCQQKPKNFKAKTRWSELNRSEKGILNNNHEKAVADERVRQADETIVFTKLPLTDFIHQSCNYGQRRHLLHFLLGVSVADKNCEEIKNGASSLVKT